jgi:uncharacterized membrane protein
LAAAAAYGGCTLNFHRSINQCKIKNQSAFIGLLLSSVPPWMGRAAASSKKNNNQLALVLKLAI